MKKKYALSTDTEIGVVVVETITFDLIGESVSDFMVTTEIFHGGDSPKYRDSSPMSSREVELKFGEDWEEVRYHLKDKGFIQY